ncbi:MAG: hypothetical protein RL417_1603 [Pseudomonadota bacterium]|jgi:hypothetical protein
MFAPLFTLLTLLSGFILARLVRPEVGIRSPRGLIEALALSLIVPSLVGLVLVEGSFFTREAILSGLGLVDALLAAVLFRTQRPAMLPSQSDLRRKIWVFPILAALLIGAALRYPSLNYVRGGQDPGVYVNIANSLALRGTLTIVDPIAAPLSKRDTPLGKIYFKNSYRAMACKPDGGCRGSFQPGFYLRGIAPSEIIPQFYHLHPIWMSYSSLAFGGNYTTTILFVFGLLCLVIFFLIANDITRTRSGAVYGTLILACSPAYAYFARFPVSEVTASLFFLCSLYFLSAGKLTRLRELLAGAIFAGLFFFTHITGFMFLALLYPALLLASYRSKSLAPAAGWAAALGLFVWSFHHGTSFSRPYSMTIWDKIGLPESLIDFADDHTVMFGVIVLFLSAPPLMLAARVAKVRELLSRITPSKRLLGWGAALALLVFGAYVALKGWRLGFTDYYASNRWIGRRWNLSGHGWWSVKHLTAAVLTFFVSPVVVLLAGWGWITAMRRSCTSPRIALFSFAAGGLALALVGKQTTAPYLYYFGRYLVPTLVPLTILFGVLGLEAIRLRSARLTTGIRAVLVTGALLCMLPFTIAQARSVEAGDLYAELDRLAALVGLKALIFVDEVNFARVELTTPLNISFGIPTIAYSRRDFTGEPLRELMAEAHALGYTVYLLSEKDRGDSLPFLKRLDSFEFFLGSLVAKEGAVMPTVFRAGRQRATLHRFESTVPEGAR